MAEHDMESVTNMSIGEFWNISIAIAVASINDYFIRLHTLFPQWLN